ncbi:DNA-directed RNA polymerase subunit D [Candidatus Woesearchaeota archaeon]|nr:DNA-directed RNA polymerase subunit D [Candidatus Woesearchaeota archaeon]
MAIKLEKLKEEKKKGKLSFLIKGADEALANTIRRLIIEEVPTLAVEDLEIKDNNSALYDEMLGLRLALMPLKTDLKSYNLKQQCKCQGEGCAQCELILTLKAGKKGMVFASEAASSDPKCVFVYPETPIVKLIAKQKVDVVMKAVLGQGKEHAKWSPGAAFYKKEPVLTISKAQNPELLAKKCSDGVLEISGSKVKVNQEKLYESNLLELYSELDKGVQLSYTDNIIFTMESWGQLSCREILQQTAQILAEKIEAMEKLL